MTESTMFTTTRKLALFAALGLAAAGSLGFAPPAQAAHVVVGVTVGVAPPAPRYVRVPPPRRGYVWAPGYWRWEPRAHRHVWVEGYWVRARPGYRYVPERWVHYGRGWRLERGHWVR
jgi:hypothetical protein